MDCDSADADFDDSSNFEKRLSDRSGLCASHMGAPKAQATNDVDEDVGDGREVETELIAAHGLRAGPIGKEIELLLFDAVLHVASGAIDGFVEVLPPCSPSVEGSDDETGI